MINLDRLKDYQNIHFYSDQKHGLEAIVAIHSTIAGTSLGGCRIKDFSSTEEALEDVLRLSKHMTYKSLLADLGIGGGKSVIIAKPGFKKTPELLQSFASFINSLNGRYIVSVDMGSDIEDMQLIHKTTPHVIGYSEKQDGAGDPGIYTAAGVFIGMKVVASKMWGSASLKNKKINVCGIGGVGRPLCLQLLKEGAHLIISDIQSEAVQFIKEKQPSQVEIVSPKKAHTVECDIFSPCAGGGVFNENNVTELGCKAIVGSANNQCSTDSTGDILHKNGKLYVPDFAVNSGGLIGVVIRGLRKASIEETYRHIDKIEPLVNKILDLSSKTNQSPLSVAMQLAIEKYQKIEDKTRILRT